MNNNIFNSNNCQRTSIIILFIIVIFPLFFSCTYNNVDLLKIVSQRDSLLELSNSQAKQLNEWSQMADTINTVFDSIAAAEGMLFINLGDKPLKKKDILSNLKKVEEIIEKQKQKILSLEKKLASSPNNHSAMILIEHLKEQIAAKDREIESLKTELTNKKVDIARLKKTINEQQTKLLSKDSEIEELKVINEAQEEGLKTQDNIINTGYVLIATKKELKKKEVISGWKNTINNLSLLTSEFEQVDIRTWTAVTIEAKSIKILTNMDKSSYEIEKVDKGIFTLHITDVSSFWSVSNYLVIQKD